MKYKFNWDDTREVAKNVARKVAKEYPGIDPEDVEQAILLEVVRRENTYRHMSYEIPQLYHHLRKYAQKYCNDERMSSYQWSDQYHYTTKEVRALCAEGLFDREAFLDKVYRDADLMANFDEIMARVADLQRAYSELREQDQNLIYRRYVIGESLSSADKQACYRAIYHLADTINKGRSYRRGGRRPEYYIDADGNLTDYVGGRTAMSNAAAGVLTHSQYQG